MFEPVTGLSRVRDPSPSVCISVASWTSRRVGEESNVQGFGAPVRIDMRDTAKVGSLQSQRTADYKLTDVQAHKKYTCRLKGHVTVLQTDSRNKSD